MIVFLAPEALLFEPQSDRARKGNGDGRREPVCNRDERGLVRPRTRPAALGQTTPYDG